MLLFVCLFKNLTSFGRGTTDTDIHNMDNKVIIIVINQINIEQVLGKKLHLIYCIK